MDPVSHSQPALTTLDKYGTRERAVDCPEYMSLSWYIARKYAIPKHSDRHKLIYHYTNSDGLLGIISSNRLWASDSAFLNDPSEGTLLPELVLNSIRRKPGGLSAIESEILTYFEEGLKKHPKPPRSFTISFCDDGDLLGQWRGYGSFGSGYAVGFAAEKFDVIQLGHLIDVQYDFKSIPEMAIDLLSIFVDAQPKWGILMNRFGEEAALLLRYLSLSYKSPAFREERETRILTEPNNKSGHPFEFMAPLKFRTRGADIVPYISLAPIVIHEAEGSFRLPTHDEPPPPLPVRRIVTGPGINYSKNKASIERLLITHGYEGVEIVPSSIPFRV
jgi:DUF2971 family protein